MEADPTQRAPSIAESNNKAEKEGYRRVLGYRRYDDPLKAGTDSLSKVVDTQPKASRSKARG